MDAILGVTGGVVEQVANDLRDTPLVGLGEDRFGFDLEARRRVTVRVLARDARDGVAQIDRLTLELLGTAGARQEREIADQTGSVERGGGDRLERGSLGDVPIGERGLRDRCDRRERRSDLVGDVGGEFALSLGGGLQRRDRSTRQQIRSGGDDGQQGSGDEQNRVSDAAHRARQGRLSFRSPEDRCERVAVDPFLYYVRAGAERDDDEREDRPV